MPRFFSSTLVTVCVDGKGITRHQLGLLLALALLFLVERTEDLVDSSSSSHAYTHVHTHGHVTAQPCHGTATSGHITSHHFTSRHFTSGTAWHPLGTGHEPRATGHPFWAVHAQTKGRGAWDTQGRMGHRRPRCMGRGAWDTEA